jgi:Tse3 toxin immunity protein Tsi3
VLPKPARVRNSDNEINIDLTKGQRLQRNLIFTTAPVQPDVGNRRRGVLANTGILEYAIEDNTGGGSGGPIAGLTGRIQIGSNAFTVKCTDQEEISREADWCLSYLNRLEIIN